MSESARVGEAKGRVDWKRLRWPVAKFEVSGAKCDLRQQQREKREESREITEKREERFGPRMAGWRRKGSAPKREEGRAPREARRERPARCR